MSSYLIFIFMISTTCAFIGDGLVPFKSRLRKISLQSNNPTGFSADHTPPTENNIDQVHHNYQGLLSDVSDVNEAHFYSTNIDLTEAYHLVNDNEYICRSAVKDASSMGIDTELYLDMINSNAENFMMQRTIWNRRDLIESLDDIISRKGRFVCLLGGRSTGKSLVLEDLVKRMNEKVILIDLRKDSNILSNLLEELEAFVIEKIGSNIDMSQIVLGKPNEQFKLLNFLLEELIKRYQLTTIIIDEANIALQETDKEEVKLIKAVLALFVRLTKQTSELNVILVSSEYSFPFLLRKPGIDFKTSVLNKLVYSGEVPPNEMYTLLTEVWGIGDHLAMALMSHYGGHIYNTYEALGRLALPKDAFWNFDASHFNDVINCLEDSTDKMAMVEILKELAEKGFSPLEVADDPVAEVISKYNVGGVVQKTGKVIGLPMELWGNNRFGIIPVSQSMRLIIAEVLHAREYNQK